MSRSVLRGDLVELRPLAASDAEALDRILRDRQVARGLPYRVRREGGAAWLARVLRAQRKGEGEAFGIRPLDERELVGQIRLFHWSRPERRAEVGYWLRRREWRRGFGTESLRLACRHGFSSMGLHRIEANVVAENARSLAILERVGFRREGLFRSSAALADGWADEVHLGLLRGELTGKHPRRSSERRASVSASEPGDQS
jgi:RimJ/RimL family protein N-acetyltransferase